MAYELTKPFTQQDYNDFLVQYNQNLGLEIVETESCVYALEADDIMQDGVPVKDSEYQNKIIAQRQAEFHKRFFNTSLGYVRRKVNMATGEIKDFLSDLLPVIAEGLKLGRTINMITYSLPDFTKDISDLVEYQNFVSPNEQFVNECYDQLNNDFLPASEE